MISKAIAYGLGIALAAASAGLAVQTLRLSGEKTAHAESRAQYAEQVAMAEAATRAESEKNRAIEQELRNAQETNVQQAEALLAALEYSAAVERVSSQRLRDAAQDLAAVARSRCAASTTPGSGPPDSSALDLFAELLGSADEAAGAYAAEADERRIRGLTCEAEYDRARAALNGAKPS